MNIEEYIKKLIINKGGNEEIASSLIENNPSLLELTEEELNHHLFLVMNNDIVYAILFIVENDLFWTTINDNKCSSLVKHDESSLDYVIVLMLESIHKYKQLIPNKESLSLEESVHRYSLIKRNEKSYHIK